MICLNKRSLLTHGSPLGINALALHLDPSSESYTAVLEGQSSEMASYGQVRHQGENRSAHLSFVASELREAGRDILLLLEELNCRAGEMGVFNVLAEIEESSPLFESLRTCGFAVYGWEVAWKLPGSLSASDAQAKKWRIAGSADDAQIRALYQALVPPVVQAAESWSGEDVRRLVYQEENEILAYVESSSGPQGLYLRPVVHPSEMNAQDLITGLGSQFKDLGQPVYLQVRSYQAWLLDALERIGGEEALRFSLLVKHLTVKQRNGVIVTNGKRVENRQAEPTAPLVNHIHGDRL